MINVIHHSDIHIIINPNLFIHRREGFCRVASGGTWNYMLFFIFFCFSHTVQQLPNSDFMDMYVTQAFTKNLIACVHESWIHIIFFNSQTFRVPSLRRDLVAMVPRVKYRIIQKKLDGSKVGDIWYDGERFYSCVDNSTTTIYRHDVIVKVRIYSVQYGLQHLLR